MIPSKKVNSSISRRDKTHRKMLKVYYRYYAGDKKPHPYIRLAGKQLDQLDFKIGDVVEVISTTGKILIRKRKVG